MLTKLLLALREDGQPVKVVTINGETRPVLGKSEPQDCDRRADAARQWGVTPGPAREEAPETIDEALPQRSQTVLSYEVDEALRQRLNGGLGELASSRRRR